MKLGIRVVGVMCSALLITGCASIVSKSSYPVTMNSHPDGADFIIKDETGEIIYKGTTPATVTLNTKAGFFKGKNYIVTFSKPGYDEQSISIERGVDRRYLVGNFLFGGLIGWLIVDPATGAMWTLPDNVTATLIGQETSRHDGTVYLRVLSLRDIPVEVSDEWVRVD